MTHPTSRFFALFVALAALVSGSVAFAQTKCTDCGKVQAVRYVEEKGQGSGVGAVAGGVVGGVLGHQIGGGRGNTVATIAGAAGGAYVGNKVEQNKNTKSYWTVTIKMDDGPTRTFTYSNQPTVKEGERVKLVDGGKRLALVAN
jgi:outer membrane lipoprotein SlyB